MQHDTCISLLHVIDTNDKLQGIPIYLATIDRESHYSLYLYHVKAPLRRDFVLVLLGFAFVK